MNHETQITINALLVMFVATWLVVFLLRYLRAVDYNRRVNLVRRLGVCIEDSERIARMYGSHRWLTAFLKTDEE